MDLSTMQSKLTGGRYQTLAPFLKDFALICSNCKLYVACLLFHKIGRCSSSKPGSMARA
jgi:hypothetical protein